MNQEYENLIDVLIKGGYLKTPEIIESFKAIDRKDFVTEEHQKDAYVNAPLPIGFGQTISQPLTVAFMMELLEPKTGEKILDIGAGSGWAAAILAYIVGKHRLSADSGESALLLAVERVPELKEMAEKNVAKYNFIEKGIARIVLSDGSKGYKKEAPYDKIIAAAAAYSDIPKDWRGQLKIGGRIVAPVGNSIVLINKLGKNKFDKKEFFGFSFVPLIEEKAAQP
ncbi:protein-L-isoaspartate O-methyltransferase [Candidatus Wolfebacteria bacterium]|nr:protein-L-isoaspartate O-methyltransferase [Candidatus Wolfebacteria bacterium]